MPDVVLEVGELFLYACLLHGHGTVTLGVVRQHAALHVIGLVYFAVITVECEIVISRHVGDIVQVRGHQRQTGEVAGHVVILDPEQGFGRLAGTALINGCELIALHEHGAECRDTGLVDGRPLVEIDALLDIVAGDLCRGNIALWHSDLAVFFLIIDAVAFQQFLHISLVLDIERLVSVDLVVIHIDASREPEAEDEGEEVLLLAVWLHGVIQRSILVCQQIQLTVDVAPPHHILRHLCRRGEHQRCAVCLFLGRGFLLCRGFLCRGGTGVSRRGGLRAPLGGLGH